MSCDNSSMTAAASSFFQIAATAFPGKNTTGQKWNEYRPLFPVLTVSSWLRGLIWFAPSNYELWVFFTLTLGDSYFPFLASSCFPITCAHDSSNYEVGLGTMNPKYCSAATFIVSESLFREWRVRTRAT